MNYSKHFLAQAYAPGLTKKAALNRLAQWIHQNRRLMMLLKRRGYYVTQKKFTAEQIKLIYKYLGEP